MSEDVRFRLTILYEEEIRLAARAARAARALDESIKKDREESGLDENPPPSREQAGLGAHMAPRTSDSLRETSTRRFTEQLDAARVMIDDLRAKLDASERCAAAMRAALEAAEDNGCGNDLDACRRQGAFFHPCALHAQITAALASDAGRGFVSPEEHAKERIRQLAAASARDSATEFVAEVEAQRDAARAELAATLVTLDETYEMLAAEWWEHEQEAIAKVARTGGGGE